MLTIIPGAVLFLLYMLYLLLPHSYVFGARVTNGLRIIQFLGLIIVLSLIILSSKGIYLSGYWAPKIIFWIWLLLNFCLFAFVEKNRIYYVERFFYKIFFVLPLLFIPFLLIPFIGVGVAVLVYCATIGDPSMIVYSSEKIRIEKSGIPFLGSPLPLDVFEKKGLLAYKRTSLSHEFDAPDTLMVNENADGRILIQVVYPGNTKTDTVDYVLTPSSE